MYISYEIPLDPIEPPFLIPLNPSTSYEIPGIATGSPRVSAPPTSKPPAPCASAPRSGAALPARRGAAPAASAAAASATAGQRPSKSQEQI